MKAGVQVTPALFVVSPSPRVIEPPRPLHQYSLRQRHFYNPPAFNLRPPAQNLATLWSEHVSSYEQNGSLGDEVPFVVRVMKALRHIAAWEGNLLTNNK